MAIAFETLLYTATAVAYCCDNLLVMHDSAVVTLLLTQCRAESSLQICLLNSKSWRLRLYTHKLSNRYNGKIHSLQCYRDQNNLLFST